jgi:hypothetical protein
MTSPSTRTPRFRSVAVAAVAAACCLAPAAAHAHGGQLPEAEILATNNTAVITDPADPRLDDELRGFERFVTDIGGDFERATIRPGHREFVGF